jgi:hypothetical protein
MVLAITFFISSQITRPIFIGIAYFFINEKSKCPPA